MQRLPVKLALLAVALLLMLPAVVSGSVIALDANYISIDDDGAVVGETYTKLFRVNILDKPGCSENKNDTATVDYTITDSGGSSKTGIFTKNSIGCWSTKDTGLWAPERDDIYEICGVVVSGSADFNNDTFCYNATAVDVEQNETGSEDAADEDTGENSEILPVPAAREACDLKAMIDAKAYIDPLIEGSNYYISIDEPSCSSTDVEVSIWIKDDNGFVLSSESFDETVTCSKTIERRLEEIENGAHVLKVFAEPVSCDDPDIRNNIDETAVIIVNSLSTAKDSVKIRSPEDSSEFEFGSVIDVSLDAFSEMPATMDVFIDSDFDDTSLVSRSLKKPAGFSHFAFQLALPDDCTGGYEEGEYTITAVLGAGSSAKAQKGISIMSSGCPEEEFSDASAEEQSSSGNESSIPVTGAAAVSSGAEGLVDSIISFFAGLFGIFG